MREVVAEKTGREIEHRPAEGRGVALDGIARSRSIRARLESGRPVRGREQMSEQEVTLKDIEEAAEILKRVVRHTAARQFEGAERAVRHRPLPEDGEHAEDRLLQAEGGLQQDLLALRLGEEEGRRRRLGGEPRAGGRARRHAPRHEIDHSHARGRLASEDRRDKGLRREGRTARSGLRRDARDGEEDSARRRARSSYIPSTTRRS